jgi:hypothetical protein
MDCWGGAEFETGAAMIRVFPARTKWIPQDDLAFVGELPLFHPEDKNTPVRVSVTFTWHKTRAEKIAESWAGYYSDVKIGGPAYGDPGGEFEPGQFLKEGCTITSRGCPKSCPWCVVPIREGPIRELTIRPGWIVQDNNLLACSESHIKRVFEMLKSQSRCIFFNGGLDKHFLKDSHRGMLDSISIGEIWLACDIERDLPHLERAAKILDGIPARKLRCYTMIGYDGENLASAEKRIERVFELGFMPFCQLYQSEETKVYSDEWSKLRRKWARPAAYMSK